MRKVPYVHLVLFLLTCLTTLVTGAFLKGIDLFAEPRRVFEGFPFSLALMTILMGHEFSHFFASKKHHTKATLPYFIPAPPILSPIGTFGAFIKMKSPITTRKALIDIGASGPVVGFLLAVVATLIGLDHSTLVPAKDVEDGIALGSSLLFSLLSYLMLGASPESQGLALHPVAFAGWIGLFVTSLNLIPIGQLDGGHVAYAFFGSRHLGLSKALVATMLLFGTIGTLQIVRDEGSPLLSSGFWDYLDAVPALWPGWALWGVIMIVLGLRHPPVMYWEVPLDRRRRVIGALALIIFVITFMPSPFKIP